MRRLWMIGLLAAVMVGCAPSTQPQFSYEDGAKVFKMQIEGQAVAPESSTFFFRAQGYDIALRLSQRHLNVSILNKAEQPLNVVWRSSSFVLPDGRVSPIAVEQRTYVTQPIPRDPTTIAPRAKLVDNFFAVNNRGYTTYSGEFDDPLFKYPFKSTTNLRFILALEQGGTMRSLVFEFVGQPSAPL